MKLAKQLMDCSMVNSPAYRAGELLIECERVVAMLLVELDYHHEAGEATLAKLRGE